MKSSRDSQRKFGRIPVRMTVRIRTGNESYIGTAVNISAGGVFIRTTNLLSKNLNVSLEINFGTLQKSDQLLLSGKIAHTSKDGIGIKFDSLTPKALTVILTLVANYMKTQASTPT